MKKALSKTSALEGYIGGKSKTQLRKIFTLPGNDGKMIFRYFLESRGYLSLDFESALQKLTKELDLKLNLMGEELSYLLLENWLPPNSSPIEIWSAKMQIAKHRFDKIS